AKFEQSVNPSDAELLRVYNQDLNAYRMPESVKVRHILFKTEGKTPEEEAKVKAQAEDVLKQVKAGGKFAELAKKYSEDPGSKDKGGEYENVVRASSGSANGLTMVKEFEDAAFSLKIGETSNLVKTTYGYHIVQT